MVTIQGNAASGYTYNAPPPDLPHDTARIRPAHKPWCVDCKRKDRPLDVDQLCVQCVHARVTRAAQRERWASRPTEPVSAREIKEWALKQGLITEIRRGRPSRDLVAAYDLAHGEVA